jgi:hypothetical protein
MADSYSTFLQVRLPATGYYDNTWGATLNSDALQLLDTAVAGWTSFSVGSAVTYSLPALTPGSSSTSRYFGLLITGTPAATCVITVPSSVTGKMYLINNQTGQSLEFTYSGSTNTVTVATNTIQLIWCDGSNCWAITAPSTDSSSLGGAPAGDWMRAGRTAAEIAASTIVENIVSIPTAWSYMTVTEAPTTTLDWHNGNAQSLTLTGNRTMAAPVNVVDGAEIDLLVIQDGTGGRTLTWNAVFWFENGTPPVLGTAAGSVDRFLMRYNAALTRWICGHFANTNAGAGTTLPITIASNTVDWSLKAVIGSLSTPATLNIQVNAGVIMEASTTGTAAMDLSGLISGCTINLTNLGYIQGKGGDGGDGAVASYPGSGTTLLSAAPGLSGGKAILGPGSGCTFNVTNANGNIWGGGGGGGGGGAFCGNPSLGCANGGGGGGGAGGGRPGRGGRGSYISATPPQIAQDGTWGTAGINGAAGTAGTGTSQGAGSIGVAGAGGTWGTAGTAGSNPATTTMGQYGAFGAAGAAGKAIELAGGSVTFVSGGSNPNVQGVVS